MPQSAGLRLLDPGEQGVEANQFRAFFRLHAMKFRGTQPLLKCRLVQVCHHSRFFHRNHFHFCFASGTPRAVGRLSAQDQQRIGFDGDGGPLCQLVLLSVMEQATDVRRLPPDRPKSPFKALENF